MIDPTEKAVAIDAFRMRYLRLRHGATDEMSDDSVPAEQRDGFIAHFVQYNKEFAEDWFERVCKGVSAATDGHGQRAGRRIAPTRCDTSDARLRAHTNRCEFELDLLKIEQEEAAEAAFAEDIGIV